MRRLPMPLLLVFPFSACKPNLPAETIAGRWQNVDHPEDVYEFTPGELKNKGAYIALNQESSEKDGSYEIYGTQLSMIYRTCQETKKHYYWGSGERSVELIREENSMTWIYNVSRERTKWKRIPK